MRYREEIPPELLTENLSSGMLLFTVSLAFVIGIILMWLGYKGKQMWLVFWSVGLIMASLSYLGYEFLIRI